MKTPRTRFKETGTIHHIAVQGDHVGKSAKHGRERTLALCTLAVDDVGLELAEFPANGADAPLVTGPQPSPFGHVQAVKPDVRCYPFLRAHWLLRARNDMHLQ